MGLPLLSALNPLQLVGDLIKAHRLNEWAKLLFAEGFSGVTSFCFVCGSSLVSHRPSPEAVGTGLVAAAVMMTVVFRRSPLTKGMLVALPTDEAKEELEANAQVISK